MRPIYALLVLVVASCASVEGASNQPPPFSSAGAPAADYDVGIDLPAGRYALDPRHASVHFRIRHMQLAWFTARFDTIDASIDLDPADPSRSQLTASVDTDSVNTGVLDRNGERVFDGQIGEALGAGAIRYTATAIERTGAFTARITGDLTMNGQTHPATLDATFDGAAVDPLRGGRQVLGFSAHGTIDRTVWGVSEWRAFTGDEVQIVIEAEFVRA